MGWMEIHSPVSVLQVIWSTVKGCIGVVRARRLAAALDFLDALVALILSRMDGW